MVQRDWTPLIRALNRSTPQPPLLLMPLNTREGTHWELFVLHWPSMRLTHYDPLPPSTRRLFGKDTLPPFAIELIKFLAAQSDRFPALRGRPPHTMKFERALWPEQQGGKDCGVMVLVAAYLLVSGGVPDRMQPSEGARMRQTLVAELGSGRLLHI